MSRHRRWLAWAVILACWTAAGLVYASHLFVYHAVRGDPEGWATELAESFANVYVWAALTALIAPLARRFRIRRSNWTWALPLHLALGLVVSLLQVTLHTAVEQTLLHRHFSPGEMAGAFQSFFARTFYGGIVVYGLIIAVIHAAAYYREQEVRSSELEANLAQAQLQALKMQLHPHFLFNTLHSISALVREDAPAAERTIVLLSDLLRLTLATGDEQEIPLEQEIDILDRYLEIEKTRFHDRLTVTIEIAPETRDALVPTLVLQPLVENSIRHGIAGRRGPGRLAVGARREGEILRLTVGDSGVGPDDDDRMTSGGIGLANTRARLAQLFGSSYALEWGATDEGFEVRLAIPFRLMEEARAF